MILENSGHPISCLEDLMAVSAEEEEVARTRADHHRVLLDDALASENLLVALLRAKVEALGKGAELVYF